MVVADKADVAAGGNRGNSNDCIGLPTQSLMDYLIYYLPAAWGAGVLFLFFGLTRLLRHPVVVHRTLFLVPSFAFLLLYFLGSSERVMSWGQHFGYSTNQTMAAITCFSILVGGIIMPIVFGRKHKHLMIYGMNKSAFRKILKEELLLCDPSIIADDGDWKSLFFDVEIELGDEGWGNSLDVEFTGAQSGDLVQELLPPLRARVIQQSLSSSTLDSKMLIRVVFITLAIIACVVMLAAGFGAF